MKKYINVTIRAVISFILSGSVLSGGVAIFSYADPGFSISLFSLLSQYSVPAWLLLCLSTAVVFVVLSRLPVIDDRKTEKKGGRNPKPEQSD